MMISLVNVTEPVIPKLDKTMPSAMPKDPLLDCTWFPLKALAEAIISDAPSLICVPPAWVFVPVKVITPVPAMTMVPEPLMLCANDPAVD